MRLGKANESDREGDGGEREKGDGKRERRRVPARNEGREANGREGVVKGSGFGGAARVHPLPVIYISPKHHGLPPLDMRVHPG